MEQDLFRSFAAYVKAHQMLNTDDTVVTGVSGGADSMALLLLLLQLQEKLDFSLLAVHVNHGIRGKEADDDEAFVLEFCKARGIPCVAEHVSVPDVCRETKESVEECARRLRYDAFCRIAKEKNAKIAVAHHREDNAETVLLHLVRGSGLRGLSGMQPISRMQGCVLIRPLLAQSRADIETFLQEAQIPYRTDATNFDTAYARNAMRQNVLPALKNINEQAVLHICESAQLLKEAEAFLEKETEAAWQRAASSDAGRIHLSVPELLEIDPVLARRVILRALAKAKGSRKDLTMQHVQSVFRLSKMQSGRQTALPGGLRARRQYDEILLEGSGAAQAAEADSWQITVPKESLTAEETCVALPDGRELAFRLVNVNAENRALLTQKNRYTKAFDYDRIKNDIIVGAKASGDHIFLRDGQKTVKKFFIDEKVPADQRPRIPLVKDGADVMWITGLRISEKHKITDATTKGLVIQLIGGEHECKH